MIRIAREPPAFRRLAPAALVRAGAAPAGARDAADDHEMLSRSSVRGIAVARPGAPHERHGHLALP